MAGGLLCVLCLLALSVQGEPTGRYEGSTVYRVIPQTDDQLSVLLDLMTGPYQLDFWKEPTVSNTPIDIRIDSDKKEWFLESMRDSGLTYSVMIDDVQTLIDQQTLTSELDHDDTRYYNLTELHEYLEEMTVECSANEDNVCEVINIGSSYEGRDLNIIKIGRSGPNRTAIWIDCGIHAREWISPAVCQYIIARLVEEPDSNTTALRDLFDWYIHPSVNVDGYEYTWTTDRMWRKTRKPNEGSDCVGTDGNRNFDLGWGGTGSSDDPCSEVYCGTEAFSEVETKALDDFLTPRGDQFALALTIHSYGQFYVWGWGYTRDEDPDNIRLLADIALYAEEVINGIHNTGYVARRSNGDMAGNTMDWAMGTAGVPFTYLFEVRDDGEYGFLLPPDQIKPTGEEIWAGVQAMAFRISQLGRKQ